VKMCETVKVPKKFNVQDSPFTSQQRGCVFGRYQAHITLDPYQLMKCEHEQSHLNPSCFPQNTYLLKGNPLKLCVLEVM
jgi:hypothetical protein